MDRGIVMWDKLWKKLLEAIDKWMEKQKVEFFVVPTDDPQVELNRRGLK